MADFSGIGQAAFGQMANIANTFLNNSLASSRESDARAENFEYAEEAARNADRRTRALYHDLYSPAAQLQQIKDAGLSPSLFYGDAGGISGQSGAQGTGASGVEPNVFGIKTIDPLTMAQIENINADTEKKKAETKNAVTYNDKILAEIGNIFADTGLKKAETQLKSYETHYQELVNVTKEATWGYEVQKAAYEASYTAHLAESMFFEAKQNELKFNFDKDTYTTRVKQMSAELAHTVSMVALANSELKTKELERDKIKTQIEKMFNDMGIDFLNYQVNEKRVQVEEINAEAYKKWVDERLEQMGKEVDLMGERLNLQKKEFWKNTVLDSAKTLAYMTQVVMTAGTTRASAPQTTTTHWETNRTQ